VRVIESPLRQPLGLAQVRVESAGYADEAASAQTLLPLVRRGEVGAVLGRLLPELAVSLADVEPAPPRAQRRYVAPPLALGLVAATPLLVVFGADALPAVLLPLAGAVYGVARHRAAGWRLDRDAVVLRSRRLARTTAVANPARLQRVTGAQSVIQRRARLADVEVAVSSGRELGVRHLDRATVDDLVGRLAALATASASRRPSP
jgi:putative membrane protein